LRNLKEKVSHPKEKKNKFGELFFEWFLGFSVAILQNKNKNQKNCQISISTFQ
jgi:hypothetical protein